MSRGGWEAHVARPRTRSPPPESPAEPEEEDGQPADEDCTPASSAGEGHGEEESSSAPPSDSYDSSGSTTPDHPPWPHVLGGRHAQPP
eukprot:scaffold159671_cov34-Tisochrysis_lutea.AAC.3